MVLRKDFCGLRIIQPSGVRVKTNCLLRGSSRPESPYPFLFMFSRWMSSLIQSGHSGMHSSVQVWAIRLQNFFFSLSEGIVFLPPPPPILSSPQLELLILPPSIIKSSTPRSEPDTTSGGDNSSVRGGGGDHSAAINNGIPPMDQGSGGKRDRSDTTSAAPNCDNNVNVSLPEGHCSFTNLQLVHTQSPS